MALVTKFSNIEIVVRLRDEHCPPHVHAFPKGGKWELRVFFSYVRADITEIELLHGKAPTADVVQAVMDKTIDNLDKTRQLFWDAVQSVCLNNKFIVVDGRKYAREATQQTNGATLVKSARYLPASKAIEYRANGSETFSAKCP